MMTTNQTDGDPFYWQASGLAEQIASQRLSPVDIVEAFLSRIGQFNEPLNAYVDIYSDSARLAAEAAQKAIRAGSAIGPFHGVPIALKDLVEIEGRITTGGSAHFRNRRSRVTATIVQRLLAHGLIILGKTQSVEFAYSGWGTNQHLGTPWNPWDSSTPRTPGGSSSGSGVAVAAGLAPWAIGTDTGGSVRLPASFCGLTGLKTTVGQVSTYGILPLSPTLDTVGPITRSALDAALLFNLIRGPDPLDPNTLRGQTNDPLPDLKRDLRGLRLGRMPRAESEGVDGAVMDAYEASLRLLDRLGAEIVDVQLPFKFTDCFPVQMTIVRSEAYFAYCDVIEDEEALLDESVRSGIRFGREISAQDYLAALQLRSEMKRAMLHALDAVDALITPTTETAAVPLAALDKDRSPSRFTRFVNMMDMCALAIPNGASDIGLPLSLQIVCKSFQEALALQIGYAVQQATDWHIRIPDLHRAN